MGGCSQSEGPACMMAVAAGLMKRQGERNLCRDSSDAPHQPEGGMEQQSVIWFDQIGIGDVAAVGGKNASLGEMIVALSRSEEHTSELPSLMRNSSAVFCLK